MIKRPKINKIVFRAAIFLVVGIFISLVMVINIGTLSWFSSSIKEGLSVNAASTRDVIKDISIESINPKEISIRRATGLESDPLIFFTLGDEAANYLSHINPSRLSSDEEKTIPIAIKMDLQQYLQLLNNRSAEDIKGYIRIQYLNEFISERMEIQFTREYLIEEFRKNMGCRINGFAPRNHSEQLKEFYAELITCIAGNRKWEDVKCSGKGMELTPEQGMIIKTVTPGLIEHVNDIENENKNLKNNIIFHQTVKPAAEKLEDVNDNKSGDSEKPENESSKKNEETDLSGNSLDNSNNKQNGDENIADSTNLENNELNDTDENITIDIIEDSNENKVEENSTVGDEEKQDKNEISDAGTGEETTGTDDSTPEEPDKEIIEDTEKNPAEEKPVSVESQQEDSPDSE